jgi:hypothetical protein
MTVSRIRRLRRPQCCGICGAHMPAGTMTALVDGQWWSHVWCAIKLAHPDPFTPEPAVTGAAT